MDEAKKSQSGSSCSSDSEMDDNKQIEATDPISNSTNCVKCQYSFCEYPQKISAITSNKL